MGKKSPKKIVISGWYGLGNIGDEAILEAMIEHFKKEYKDCGITVLSFNPKYTIHTQKVHAVHQIPIHGLKTWIKNIVLLRWIATLRVIIESDIFVMGGGGFLSDWQPEVPVGWLKQMRIAKFFGKQTELHKIGAGPFLTLKGKQQTKYYIDKFVDNIIVRDEYSYKALTKEVGISQKITIEIDPVAEMDVHKFIIKDVSDKSISLIFTEYFKSVHFTKEQREKWNDLFEAFCTQIDVVLEQEYLPKLVFFQPKIEEELAQKFLEKFGKKIIIKYPKDYKEAIDVLNQSQAIISFRLHGNILAYALNKPFLPIIYHHKTAGFLDQIKYPFPETVLEVGDGKNWKDVLINKVEWREKTTRFLEKIKDNFE